MTQTRLASRLSPLLILSLIFLSASNAWAERDWLRYPAISPDGKTIAFSFKGDLWTVSSSGGQAKLLTSHEGYEKQPVWSPDSKSLAFASDRHGNFDIFTISRNGGHARRLTFHSNDDIPNSYLRDGSAILFSSTRLDAHDAVLPSTRMSELYRINVHGGRAEQVFSTPAERATVSPNGEWLAYHDFKGYENAWRKHHVSSVARDIWIYKFKTKKHQKWTAFRGEDRNPVWNPTGTGLYYLSEKSGSFNVWFRSVNSKKGQAKQITQHTKHPARFLTISDKGTLVYGFNGQIWRCDADGEPKEVTIQLTIDQRSNPLTSKTFKSGATEFKVSPDGREIAFIVRGEVFVCSVKSGDTKQITKTPEQERSLSWSPDGTAIYYAAERPESWNIYRSKLARKDDQLFSRATLLTEEKVMVSGDVSFQPVVSPDGKLLAYIQNRDAIHVLNLETGWSRTLVPARRNYSYSDGDIQFQWSPDSQWLAFTYLAHNRWLEDIGVVKVTSGKIYNVSKSGYYEGNPVWGPDGHSLLFKSNRYGRKNHGSWGSDVDIMAWYLNDKAHESALLSFDDWNFLKGEEKAKEKKAKEKKDEKSETKKKDGDKKNKASIKIQWKGQEDRFRRMTLHSTDIGNYVLSHDGESLLYFARVEKSWDLWLCHRRKNLTKKYLSLGDSSGGDLQWTKDGKTLFVFRGNGRIEKLSIGGSFKGQGTPKRTPVSYSARMTINSSAEREYLFDHVWRQVKAKFYDPKLHGVPWLALGKNYRAFLPSINNNHDFAELLSELLGELNASHTGSGYRFHGKGDQTASLGFIYDQGFKGAPLKIAEVIAKGPADKVHSKIKSGDLITHINGEKLELGTNPNALLNNQVNQRVRITLMRGKKSWEEVVKATSLRSESQWLYKRWVKARRVMVDSLSKGQIGYTHARSMGDSSFRTVYRETLGLNSDKKALIVDTRFNGGGWLHEDLVSFLSGREYLYFVPRGKKFGQLGAEPFTRWTRPVVVIQSEGNYSDAHIFPYAFKKLKIGKLIGTPVAGTGTAVWWETLIDRSLYFGIPQVGMMTKDGKYLENQELKPDVFVYNDPNAMNAGEDPQLKRSVEVLLNQVGKKR